SSPTGDHAIDVTWRFPLETITGAPPDAGTTAMLEPSVKAIRSAPGDQENDIRLSFEVARRVCLPVAGSRAVSVDGPRSAVWIPAASIAPGGAHEGQPPISVER